MAAQVFTMPDVGEGLTEAEILRWLVQPGDTVAINQMIVEIETAKAAVELPCPFAGVVEELYAAEGTVVEVGSPIISIGDAVVPSAAPPQRQAVLVGYGVRENGVPTRRRRQGITVNTAAAADVGEETPALEAASPAARAKPLVRKLARDKGVDISKIPATGLHGEVTRSDVVNAIGGEVAQASVSNDTAGERIPVRGVQRAMAEAMVLSAFTAPHVTEWVDVDMTRALEVVKTLREAPANGNVRVTPLLLVAVGLIRAARLHPRINSSWIDTNDGADIVLHRDVHLGIAADTPRGLLVPTIRNASSMGLVELARQIQAIVDKARAGRCTPADLTGGTISLTNFGVFGADGATPIISPGQTSILAMGRVLDRAWVVNGQVVPRPIMQLSFSFDHRVIDGAIGSRALKSVATFLEDPALALIAESTSPITA